MVLYKKFNEKGNMKWFPGNTIVSDLSMNNVVIDIIRHIHKFYRELPFHQKYALLPERSLHMTVFELLCHFNRKESYWSSYLSIDESIENVDAFFYNCFDVEQFPRNIKMKPLSIVNSTLLELRPYDKKEEKIIKEFRDHLAKSTGVRFPNHDHYKFHISFGYKLQDLTAEEQKHINNINEELVNQILKINCIDIQTINYTIFEDMSEFVPYDDNARELLKLRKGY